MMIIKKYLGNKMARIAKIQEYNSNNKPVVPAVSAPNQPVNPIPANTVEPVLNQTPASGIITKAEKVDVDSSKMDIPYKNAQELHDDVVPRVRSNIIQGLSYEDAMSKGNISPSEYISELKKKAESEGRELNEYEAALAWLKSGDMETPEEKAKRERREQLGNIFSNLGNVIGNAANLYYASKGASPIDLNSSMRNENERIKRIKEKRDALKEKQDTILFNAKIGNLSYERDKKAAEQKAQSEREKELEKRAYELMKQNVDLSYKQARDKAEMDLKEKQFKETKRSNQAKERIGWANANNAKEKNKATEGKYAVSFDGRFGTYRFKDKDRAYAHASRVISIIKEEAQKKGDEATVQEINDAYADLKNPSIALEFARQKLANYPQAEKYISERVDEKSGDIFMENKTEGKKTEAISTPSNYFGIPSVFSQEKDYSQYEI